MNTINEMNQPVTLVIHDDFVDTETAKRLKEKFYISEVSASEDLTGRNSLPESPSDTELILRLDADGLSLVSGDQILRGDFTQKMHRLRHNELPRELLVRTAKIKNHEGPLTAVDATAGLGEDSLLLAAAGFNVYMYERNPVIFELLSDAIIRAAAVPELADIVARMHVFNQDSIHAMKSLDFEPDVILLDPMFPERQKSALVKKKLQMIQKLEIPCMDEDELMFTAMEAKPKKLIIKRPPKGPYLCGLKPDHSLTGKAVRFDCFVDPYNRLHKFKK